MDISEDLVHLPFPNVDAEAFAEQAWAALLTGVFTPLEHAASRGQLAEARSAFLQQAIPVAKSWVVGSDIKAPMMHMLIQAHTDSESPAV